MFSRLFNVLRSFWHDSLPPEPERRQKYKILCAPDIPTLEERVGDCPDFGGLIGGPACCAWTEPGVGPVQFFIQAVIVWEIVPSTDADPEA